jgi:UDPglucose 6-dehydrogenase
LDYWLFAFKYLWDEAAGKRGQSHDIKKVACRFLTMDILVIGAGYVGLTSAACLSGCNRVRIHDKDKSKLDSIRSGRAHFFEKGLDAIVESGIRSGNLVAIDELREGNGAAIILICVGTPSKEDGSADMGQVLEACREIGALLREPGPRKTIAIRSTVTPGTLAASMGIISKASGKGSPKDFGLVSNPEFLRQGSAIADFMDKAPAIIGSDSGIDIQAMGALYGSIGREIAVMSPKSAEMAKYVSNCFNATKVSFMNEMGSICKLHGVDVNGITAVLYPGMRYMNAGAGFGGSCLEKDVRAMAHESRARGIAPSMLESVLGTNERTSDETVMILERRAGGIGGKSVCVLGLAYKKGTDDVRNSFAKMAIKKLAQRGARVIASDPKAIGPMRRAIPDIEYEQEPQKAVDRSDAVLILTDWDEFCALDFKGKPVVDGRCIVRCAGEGIHRP